MTNREYEKKQHRGSSPAVTQPVVVTTGREAPATVEWQNTMWYPVSDGPPTNGLLLHRS